MNFACSFIAGKHWWDMIATRNDQANSKTANKTHVYNN